MVLELDKGSSWGMRGEVSASTPKLKSAPRRRGLKRCSLGSSCPYRHEHQHTSEYFHDETRSESKDKQRSLFPKGKGRKLGTGASTHVKRTISKYSGKLQPFKGTANTLRCTPNVSLLSSQTTNPIEVKKKVTSTVIDLTYA